MTSPVLLVLVGPSGVGKGTVVRRLREKHPQIVLSVSATTRAPRVGEVDAVHYHFISPQRFDALVTEGGMLEWAQVFGLDKYGTPRQPVLDALAEGHPVILEIDLEGARQVRGTMPDALFVFLAPPSPEELERRLVERGTEAPEAIARRLATARTEMASMGEFDAVVTNVDVEQAASELARLMGLE
ncbi:guanylate kinase [Schaalia sp. 19OD2882]|uniref:guanylate kinase n=1 Tax=Schaalia sp. 19OD2882 TaxID=2794089 RepID=UPI001C1EB976|nr:guanylate kinase [Schaalia sp. 19OD2882]QWW18699.1 guanylate kinase [Schaalia sp. 19OD2882]